LTARFNWRAFATTAGGDDACVTADALGSDAARADDESTEIPTSKAARKRSLVMTCPSLLNDNPVNQTAAVQNVARFESVILRSAARQPARQQRSSAMPSP
jgi:hypothetical protein